MRSKTFFRNTGGLLMACLLILNFFACEDKNEFPVDGNYARMFRPSTFSCDNVKATSAELTWSKVKSAKTYVIDISKDSLAFTNLVQTFTINSGDLDVDATSYSLKINDLIGATIYSARIKCTSGTDLADSKYDSLYFTTSTEQIMQPVDAADITARSVILKWGAGAEVTHFLLVPEGGTSQQYDISADEKAAGQKTISGLTSETSYTATIYNTISIARGSATFKTYAEIPVTPGAGIINLTISDSINQTTFDTLTSNPVTIIFPVGGIYSYNSSLTLKDGLSVTFFGTQGATKPILALNVIYLGTTAGTIKFENLDITGLEYSNGLPTATKHQYLFNQGTINTTDSIIFENCIIRNFTRSVVRLKDVGTKKYIGKLRFNNCISYDQGSDNYPYIRSNIADGTIDNIVITNSTFYNLAHTFIEHNLTNLTSLIIDNCTFDSIVGASRYLIDCSASFGPGTFNISNTIFGSTYSQAATGGAKGIRTSTTVSPANSYKTANWITSGGNSVSGLADYTNTADNLFTNRKNGDFTIKDNTFDGKGTAGDPRWRK